MENPPVEEPAIPTAKHQKTQSNKSNPKGRASQGPKSLNQANENPQRKPKGKQGGESTTKQSVPNRHAYQRMNYLYQAAQVMVSQKLRLQSDNFTASIKPETGLNSFQESNTTADITTQAQIQALDNSARRMNSTLRNVAQRMQVRLSTDIKRSLCRDCNTSLQPGTGNSFSQISSKDTLLEVSCVACKRVKRFPLREGTPKHADVDEMVAEKITPRTLKQRKRLRERKVRMRQKAEMTRKKILAAAAV